MKTYSLSATNCDLSLRLADCGTLWLVINFLAVDNVTITQQNNLHKKPAEQLAFSNQHNHSNQSHGYELLIMEIKIVNVQDVVYKSVVKQTNFRQLLDEPT